MRVKRGAVNAGQDIMPPHFDPARTAHSGSIDHERVKTYQSANRFFFRDLCDRLGNHYGRRTNDEFNAVMAHHLAQRAGHKTFPLVCPVIGGNHDLVAGQAHLILEQQGTFGLGPDDAKHAVFQPFEFAAHRQDLGDPQTITDTGDKIPFAHIIKRHRHPQRTDDHGDRVANLQIP